MAELTFITAEVCPFAQRTHLALLEKGLDFEHAEIDLGNKPGWFEEVSPYSKVPVLKRGDDIVFESTIINEYLEEAYPEPALMPTDMLRRANARIWIDFANTRVVPSFYKLLLAQDPARRAELADTLTGHLRYIESQGLAKLGASPYWLGEEVSLVDLTFYPHFERFAALTHYRGVAIPDDCPRLKAWLAAMQARDSVKATRHDDAYYIASYTKYADDTAKGVTAREMRGA
ncbi:MAG: glutathione S-transferase family protein [Proteobacteria bacterium]|nr:glutathione S-transferase family protein [Pseudomonadota bacterium]